MIPKQCKRLAEVDFPLATVSNFAEKEKSVRQGHPSTFHLWWARRPLASSRAMLLALLLPDPCDPHCPGDFKAKGAKLLQRVLGKISRGDTALRKGLLKFVGDFANWELQNNPAFLETAVDLIRAAHGEDPPLVVDPFAGGGSIPLEALRLGCDTFASDLNPVACFILKVMLECIPRNDAELADALREAGGKIVKAAERELESFYPGEPDGSKHAAYLWARTVRCESPNCGAEIPLLRSFWLCQKEQYKRALRYRVHRKDGKPPRAVFEIFEPRNAKEVPAETVTRAKATCLCCKAVLLPERVRAQLAEARGGTDVLFDKSGNRIGGARMLAVVTVQPKTRERRYRLPTATDYAVVQKCAAAVDEMVKRWSVSGRKEHCPIPVEPTPKGGGSGASRAFSVQKYGMKEFADLFTARQKLSLATVARLIREADIPDALRMLLSCALSVFARHCNGNARIHPDSSVAPAFGMHTLPITWTFPETVLLGGRTENFDGAVSRIVAAVENFPRLAKRGQVEQADATEHPLPDETADVWFSDPPYYDAIPYADLSDFFLVWLKRAAAGNFITDPFDRENPLSPKRQEAILDTHRAADETADDTVRDGKFYEAKMTAALAEGRRVLNANGVCSVVFAHKTTDGWEALLNGIVQSGWTVTGSWPIATERASRLRARDSAALATSVHLVCRPRPDDAGIGDWADVLKELGRRVVEWMSRLEAEGVRGADLVFACIGPALEVFSRYGTVEKSDGRVVTLSDYLHKVWEVIGETALKNIIDAADGATGALEEDARLLALFLWTLQSTFAPDNGTPAAARENEDAPQKAKGFSLQFDIVRRFAQPLGIDLKAWEGRIIETEKGVVRLLPVPERAKQLFGVEMSAGRTYAVRENLQQTLFPHDDAASNPLGRGGRKHATIGVFNHDADAESTTLDRVHAAMLLQLKGEAYSLRAFIESERERGPAFLRLANAFSALYPAGSVEKRLLDAMLLTVRG